MRENNDGVTVSNVLIDGFEIRYDRDFPSLTIIVDLDDYAMFCNFPDKAGRFIIDLMRVAGVDNAEKLKGMAVRKVVENGKLIKVMNIISDEIYMDVPFND